MLSRTHTGKELCQIIDDLCLSEVGMGFLKIEKMLV